MSIFAHVDRDRVVFSLREWCQPYVEIIVGEVISVDELLDSPGICAIAWKYVDIRRESGDIAIFNLELLAILVEDLDACQS